MANNPSMLWQQALDRLRSQLPEASVETWFASADVIELLDHELVIAVPDTFTKGGIERRYRATIEQILSDLCCAPMSLRVHTQAATAVAPEPIPTLDASDETHRSPSSASAEWTAFNPDYTFDLFIRGECNKFALAAARKVSEQPGKAYNPLFIYGNVGLGKTHLLQAIGSFARAEGKSVVYTTSERFANELIHSIRTNSTSSFRERYRRIDVLLIDDVQFFQSKEATQEELFHTFNELYGAEKQIVLSSDRAPEDLSGLQERLVSRFRWGLVADIQAPDLETRIAILHSKASYRGVDVDDSILELIASRISSNIRALEGALIRAIAYAELQGVELTPRSVESTLPKEGRRERLSIEHIKDEVASRYHLKREDLEGASRQREIAQARHIAVYLSRELTRQSFPAIGKAFGNRDHTTAMHSYVRIKQLLEETPLLHSEIQEMRDCLASRYSVPR
ncbi:chromosomal replication initiator protein DnaA [Candidatus Bipolaricaulota bacterium]|nr:chromosomal replication initiator protein DnaA [Candidatus Bipolaricaulota bacterium]